MNDTDYMSLALKLAKSTLGQTAPNPVVGAVVVKDNQIVGMGAHLKAGEPHAEVHAIEMAGEKAKDATIYVTLEPCSHFGKTPPCSDLVIRTGIKKVFVATTDPNPQVAGKGIARIRNAGIEVEVGLLQEEARELNKMFFYNISTGLPYVTLKTANSLDGKTATPTGESKWITGEEARKDVHVFRHQHDAILVGVNTVIKDNPSLTTRLPSGGKNPIRIILDTNLRTPLTANVVTDGQAQTWIVTCSDIDGKREKEYHDLGVKLIKLPEKQIIIREMLKVIGEMGISSLFVEGGAEVHGSFLKERAFQQVITYIAPKLIGGKLAPASFGGEGFETMEEVVSLKIKEVGRIGNDLRIIAEPK
ncbi:bifunctional diaminohydroxyphosphoribosylaminopyrimidine deaminase/5-amino-6-(5-phosphoribosylamino)uracil reductase RibD [Neobacillus cucumis]|uniref:bifunctional diaminohydroxyphosphoribosylaminopyrimidine deaminase/5-amino-6-(5-phosphoribosylamino)uracil reductase RibD n=1 Tax=Neobacillus cucumis TaxID=1740721 RepID=UPI0018DFE8D5|nr:bifunctional diaminohydroxyphosphoribosylaminopyrimidine deaminase/5-amino-6-(5-phosphoribosylamino)uracil reductase RibD [Neobacillus cucumis]MBI0577070.1 bifunctional diaminohydroxyphosphoribosylaminopyrimidine deaminase/5-amino-6-(5-phosphoribosylamino)uracil reductase RibD [Neobacillus cucumis]WHY94063.1 bifunctional diaminohydroxyphosphoribosylaminopyrimidine deaminase/5-amino-6-(5-phosphoribosylamino)uracil reductase RibD [Neobacillus cucumis]